MKIRIHANYRFLHKFLRTIPSLFDSPETRSLDSRHHEVKVVEAPNDSSLVVKRFRAKGLGGMLRWKSPAHAAYDNARRLRHRQIDTPSPVCCIDQRRLGLLSASYYVAKDCPQDSCEVFLREGYPDLENLATALVRHIMRAHATGVLLGRPRLSDILFERRVRQERGFKTLPRFNADGTPTAGGVLPEGTRVHYHFLLLATHRVRIRKVKPTRKQCLRDLSRLTSDRELLAKFVALYARERNWDDSACVKKVMK